MEAQAGICQPHKTWTDLHPGYVTAFEGAFAVRGRTLYPQGRQELLFALHHALEANPAGVFAPFGQGGLLRVAVYHFTGVEILPYVAVVDRKDPDQWVVADALWGNSLEDLFAVAQMQEQPFYAQHLDWQPGALHSFSVGC